MKFMKRKESQENLMRAQKQDLSPISAENVATEEITLSRKEKVFANILGLSMGIGGPGLSFLIHHDTVMRELSTSTAPFATSFGTMVALMATIGVMITTGYKAETKRDSIIKTVSSSQKPMYQSTVRAKVKELKKSPDNRTLVNSFFIKETSEIDITEWRLPNGNVTSNNATHEVKNYLIKEKGKFRVEQEVIPNNETIWDISADALVEVYGVQEKTDSVKEVTA